MGNVVFLVEEFTFRVCFLLKDGVHAQDLTDFCHMKYKLICQCLFAECRKTTILAEYVEIVKIDTSIVKIDYGLHTFRLDFGK